MVLEEYAGTFAYIGSLSMTPFTLMPLYVCWNIIKAGVSDHIPAEGFIDGLKRSFLFYQYGKLLKSDEMMQTNLFGMALHIIYMILHVFYLKEKKKIVSPLLKSSFMIATLVGYANFEDPKVAHERFGYLFTIMGIAFLQYPMKAIKYVLQSKTTYGMPYSLIIFGTYICAVWFLFAVSTNNLLLMINMGLPLFLGIIQIILYFIYPSQPTAQQITEFFKQFEQKEETPAVKEEVSDTDDSSEDESE